jgi:DNA-binding PadR family transcriptional regulator
MLEFIILGTLYLKPLTGYDIRKCIEDGIGMFYKASYGSIYPILSKLSERGYVICVDELQGKRASKKYNITECGRTEFIKWLNEDNDSNSSIESFMAKVFFFDKLPCNLAYKKISDYEEKLLDYQKNLIKKKEKYEALENKEAFYFKISTLYYGICKLQGIIMWCETVKIGNDLELLQIVSPKREVM